LVCRIFIERQAAGRTFGCERPLYVDGAHRYEGYHHMIENPRIAVTFLEQYL
jgi:hypothetical protein